MKEKAHSELSASASHRWLNCPGSVMLAREVPPLPDTKYSIEGTKAHELLEDWIFHLKSSRSKYRAPKRFPRGMVSAVKVGIDVIDGLWVDRDCQTLEAETKVSLAHIHESMFGTADIRLYEFYGDLYILDYKHGYHTVEVLEQRNGFSAYNPQLIYYALASAHELNYDFQNAITGIIQPRGIHHEGPYRKARIKMRELRAHEVLFRKGVDRVFKKNPATFAGPWCGFCPAQKICSKFKKYSSSEAAKAFSGFTD